MSLSDPLHSHPHVVFCDQALSFLRTVEKRTEPGWVLSITWSLRGETHDEQGHLTATFGPGLVLGWHCLSIIQEARIVHYPGVRVVFNFPPTDASQIVITVGPSDRSPYGLLIKGEIPFDP